MLGHIMAEIISHAMIHYRGEPRAALKTVQKHVNDEIEKVGNMLILERQRAGKPLINTTLRPYARNYIKSYNKWRAEHE